MKNIKKLSFLLLFTALTANLSFAQDLITKKSGEDVKAKVIEVTTTEIKYKKTENLNGPLFTILKSDVFSVRYENGSKDVFNDSNTSEKEKDQNNDDMITKAKADSKLFYKGRNSGAIWTGAAAAVTSPIIGLIPAIICSSAEPQDDNLNSPNTELMKNTQYNITYKKEAHKIKRGKIWRSFGIGSAIWLVFYLVTNRG